MYTKKQKMRLHTLSLLIALTLISYTSEAIEFNTEVLDAEDRQNIDLSAFSASGYIYPGEYQLKVAVNRENISPETFKINILKSSHNQKLTTPCLTKDIILKLGLNGETLKSIHYSGVNACANINEISGIEITPILSDGFINIQIPTALLDYSDATWVPPSRWDDGIPGAMIDYNISSAITNNSNRKDTDYTGYNGSVGFNGGPWRLRADYQGYNQNNWLSGNEKSSNFSWNRVYLYRAIRAIRSNLSLGENYINSEVFDSWKYLGMSLQSDDRMLPPKLRGFSQQISGIAETNAQVRISQQGRVLYESTVPAGNFTIQDLDSFVRGNLDVEVIEQNGKVKSFQVDVSHVPFLTRPGQVRYKSSVGRPVDSDHNIEGPSFGHSEFSWGINNHWSMYGGGIVSEKYGALSTGVGRDLFKYGAISADVTQSVASFPTQGNKQGKSWRFSYAKQFTEINADLSLAGYRFSEESFLTMNQYLAMRYTDEAIRREKELYTITFNKYIEDWSASFNIQYSYQTYWNNKERNYYSFSAHKSLDIVDFKHISLSLTTSRTEYNGRNDDSLYFRVSLPLNGGYLSYSNGLSDNKRLSQQAGYSSYNKENNSSYSLNAGINSGGNERTQGQFSAYYSQPMRWTDFTANLYTVEGSYTSLGLSASGGATIATEGASLHSGGYNGSTRLLVDTNGIENISISGGKVKTNRWGKGILTNVSSYYRNTAYVDIKKLPDDVEAKRPASDFVLTEGAIGYRKFDVLKGIKLYANIRMADHSYPPFGALIQNNKGNELGIVSDSGLAWLTGVSAGETLSVRWGDKKCTVQIPELSSYHEELILPCQ